MGNTTQLRAGQALTITAGVASTGTVRRVEDSGSTISYQPADIAAGSTTVVGPFSTDRTYEVITTAGAPLTYSVAVAEVTASSAGLASSLSDETGTGLAVFNEAPTITKGSLSGVCANLTTLGSADSYTIPATSQSVVYDTLTVDGTLTVLGTLAVLAWP